MTPATTPAPATLDVVVAQAHPVMLDGITAALQMRGHAVSGTADSADEAYALVDRHPPDVVLADVILTRGTGVELARRLARHHPGLGVVLYAPEAGEALLRGALDAGARGIVMKSGSQTELVGALERVAAGATYIDPRAAPLRAGHRASSRGRILSGREREILQHLARGRTGEEVAEALVLSPETVRTHIRNAMAKLGAGTRTRAVVVAMNRGEIDP